MILKFTVYDYLTVEMCAYCTLFGWTIQLCVCAVCLWSKIVFIIIFTKKPDLLDHTIILVVDPNMERTLTHS